MYDLKGEKKMTTSDDLNPKYMFSGIATELLLKVVKKRNQDYRFSKKGIGKSWSWWRWSVGWI